MSVGRIASRYAKSLLDLAVEQNKVEEVRGDMMSFGNALKNRDLFLLVKSPIVNTTKKLNIFKALFGDKFNETTNAFLNITLKKGRESFLPDIVEAFESQYKKMKHISSVKLTTATALTDSSVNAIKAKLLESDMTGNAVEIETVTDPNIIGGFVIEMEDKLYDASVSYKLDQLRKEITGK